MTPKEKAKELVKRYACLNRGECINDWIDRDIIFDFIDLSCALIAVDEIIYNINPIEITQLTTCFKSAKDFNDNLVFMDNYITKNLINEKLYWQEVKQEIEKL